MQRPDDSERQREREREREREKDEERRQAVARAYVARAESRTSAITRNAQPLMIGAITKKN